MDDVWTELRGVLAGLREDSSRPLQGYPDPRGDRDRHPPFAIRLQPWATEVAAQLHKRFGDQVRLTVGSLSYPDPAKGWQPLFREAPDVGPNVLMTTLAEPLSIPSGHTAHATPIITNTGSADLAIRTAGQLVGLVLDTRTRAVVGGYSGAQRLRLVVFRAAPGETVEVPLLVGTASFVPELGYAIPPGEWVVAADLDLGGRVVRTPGLPLTVT